MSVRIRLLGLVSTYGFVLAVVLAVLGLLAIGAAGQTYLNPPVETVSEETHQQTITSEVHTAATVVNDTALYEENQELRDMPVYFVNATPNLTYQVRTTGPSDATFDVEQRLVLHMQAARGGDVFWESHRILAGDAATVDDGVHWVNATVDMTDIRTTIEEKQRAVGTMGSFEVQIRLDTTYETPQYSGTLSASTALVTTGRGYWLESRPAASETHSQVETQTVVQDPDLGRVGVLIGLGILGLIGATLVFRTYRTLDHEQLATQRARAKYEEWISNGEIPTKSEKEYVRVDSLEDLVDIAIDTSKRVIYDTELDAYAVVEGDLVYSYTTGDENLTDWFDI